MTHIESYFNTRSAELKQLNHYLGYQPLPVTTYYLVQCCGWVERRLKITNTQYDSGPNTQ